MLTWPPNLNQQLYPGAGDVDDCWCVATIWTAGASRPGIHEPTVPEFRRHAGDPDDGFQDGGSLTEVIDGARGSWPDLPVLKYDSTSWSILRRLMVDEGRPASVALDSAALPSIHRYGFYGKHQCGLAWDKARRSFVLANPLAPAGSNPKPIAEAAIRFAMQQLLPQLKSLRAAVFPAPPTGDDDMPGLSLIPIAPMKAGTATVPEGVEVIRVSDRKRSKTTAAATGRAATGLYDVGDIAGEQLGYLVEFADGLSWVRLGTMTFHQTSVSSQSYPVKVGGKSVGSVVLP